MGELEGVYVNSRSAKNKRGQPIMFHEFKTDSGEIVSVLGGTVLDRVFSTQVEKGSRVKVAYVGQKPGKNGDYKDYSVEIWEDETF